MKKNNEKATKKVTLNEIGKKGIVSTALVGLLLQSCSVDSWLYNNDDNIYGDVNIDQEAKLNLLNMNELLLTDEFNEYIQIISLIIEDITTNKASAELFCNDTEKYIEQSNYKSLLKTNISITIPEHDKKLLLCLTDQEILDAAHAKNFRVFLNLCISKGYFIDAKDILTKSYCDYKQLFKSEEDYEKFISTLKSMNQEQAPTRSSDECMCDEWIVGAPAIAIGVAAVEFAIVSDKVAWTTSVGCVDQNTPFISPTRMSNEPALKIWFNNNSSTTTDEKTIFYDTMITSRVNEVVNTICEEFPQINKEELRNMITINYINYYGYK